MVTFDEIVASNKEYLIPADIAGLLRCHAYAISVKAKEGTLPFPFIRTGNRTKIPRLGFINWWTHRDRGGEHG